MPEPVAMRRLASGSAGRQQQHAAAETNDIRRYEITDEGIAIGKPVLHYEGLLGGRPVHTQPHLPVPRSLA
nr:hypothetical protein [uncultured Albidiferax sp.]